MLKPDLIEFKPKTLAKSEEVNYNFEQMGNYVFGTADELKALVQSTVANLNLQITQNIYTGKIEMYAGKVENIPLGWLLCDGSEVDRTEYEKLYNAIGVKYGEGNGVTTFNLPNLIGRFLEGGTEAGIVKEAGLPNIEGEVQWTANGRDVGVYQKKTGCFSDSYRGGYGNGHQYSNGYVINFNAANSNPIYGNSDTVQPPSVTVLYIIKT